MPQINWSEFSLKPSFGIDKAEHSLGYFLTDPKFIIAFIGTVLLMVGLVYVARVKLSTKAMVHLSMAIALGTVLKMFKIMQMPMGGSVTLGSMIPILFIAYVYGARAGFLAGVLFGIIDLILAPFIYYPAQFLLDYVLAFGALGVAGYFRNNIILGSAVAIALRLVFHVLSGVLFFQDAANGGNVWLYSITYNGLYLVPEALIAVVILVLIPMRRIKTEVLRSAY